MMKNIDFKNRKKRPRQKLSDKEILRRLTKFNDEKYETTSTYSCLKLPCVRFPNIDCCSACEKTKCNDKCSSIYPKDHPSL
jgi:hypothetical protein